MICYTCIVGNYDDLRDPLVITKGWKYICFTNNPNITSNIYEIIRINENIHPVKLARKYKILAPGIKDDVFIWHDANMQVNCNLDELVERLGNNDLMISIHPERDCLYKEALKCIELKKDIKLIIEKQILRYHGLQMPYHFGLYATGILIRRRFDQRTLKFYMDWWGEVRKYSRRDQISFPFALWNNQMNIDTFSFQEMLEKFIKFKHNKNSFGGKYDKG
jgi:hypothetical protein